MPEPAPGEVVRDRLKAFLVFIRPKLIMEGVDQDRLSNLRRLSDMRVRKFAIGKNRIVGLELCGFLADPRTGRFDEIADATGLASKGHLAATFTPMGEEMGFVVEACLLLQVLGTERLIALARAFTGLHGALAAVPLPQAASASPAARIPPAVARLLGTVKELWTISPQARKALEILGVADSPVDAVCAEIRKESDLAAEFLRVVNVSSYGLENRIVSLQQALVALGYPLARRMLVLSALLTKLLRPHSDVDFDFRAFWTRTLRVAHGAALTARSTRLGTPDDHFLAGLSHAVGKLVEYQHLREPLRQIQGQVKMGTKWEAAETAILETTYAEIGSCVLEQWRFPASVVAAARHHLMTAEQVEETQLPREAVVVAALAHISDPSESIPTWSAFLRIPSAKIPVLVQEADAMSKDRVKELLARG